MILGEEIATLTYLLDIQRKFHIADHLISRILRSARDEWCAAAGTGHLQFEEFGSISRKKTADKEVCFEAIFDTY